MRRQFEQHGALEAALSLRARCVLSEYPERTKDIGHLSENVYAMLKGPLSDDVVCKAKRCLSQAGSRPLSDNLVKVLPWVLPVRNFVVRLSKLRRYY